MTDVPDNPHVQVSIEERDGALVAVKVALDDIGCEAIRHELRVLTVLRHPNIVELVDADDSDAAPRMSTAFAGRTDLADSACGDTDAMVRIGVTLVATVQELHEMRWCHGAISKGHCIVGSGDRITLCSFGQARHLENDDAAWAAAVRRDLGDVANVLASLVSQLPEAAGRSERRRRDELGEAVAALSRNPSPAAAERCLDTFAELSGSGPTPRVIASRSTGRLPTAMPPSGGARSPVEPKPFGILTVVLVAVAIAVAGVAIWRLGGPLRPPWVLTARRNAIFGDVSPAAGLAIDLARSGALLACAYGAVVCAVAAAVSIRRRDALDDVLARIAPPLARRMVIGAVGVGMVTSAAGRAPDRVAVTWPSPVSESTTSQTITTTSLTATTSTTVATTVLDSPDIPDIPDDETAPVLATPPSTAPSTALATWTIRPGDHLWRVAAATVESHLGRTPRTAEVDPYWRALIELNRHRLADPDNPDLVFAGQVFELPPIV